MYRLSGKLHSNILCGRAQGHPAVAQLSRDAKLVACAHDVMNLLLGRSLVGWQHPELW